MASKLGLAGGIPERRVKPIWDAIDSRQYKNALKLSTSLLSKHPNSPYALALKALILERMGKCDEALSSCLNAKGLLYKDESLLMDDLTLSTLQIVFQRLDRLDLATSCYEYACGKYPNNMDLMMGLFNCYVREYSFVKQQQTAIKMYKLVGEERFLIWAVCSIQLQVLCDNGGEKLLALAEGLLKKHVSSHSLHEPEAVMVYIAILEWQAKYGDALEILSGKLGSLLLIEADKLRIQGRLHAQSGDYSAGANIYQKILRLCPDDWECFLNYLRCLLEDDSNWNNRANNDLMYPKLLDCKVSNLADGVFDSRISDALAYVQKLQAQSNDDSIRCPYLATLEIGRRKLLHEKGSQDEIVQDLLQYFSKFGHLTCFTSDVEVYVQSLTPEKKAEFLDKLMKNFNSISTVPTRDLGTSITKFKVRELIGDMNNLSVSELEGYAVQMVDMYCTSLPLSKDLDLQESMYGEELLSLACNLLVQLFCRTRQVGYIAEAIMVLEFGLTIRRCVWHYKILLLHLHSYFGNLTLALQWYKSLDVKNILMETALHHILPEILVSPLWKDLENLLRDYLRFMDDHFRESADLTFLAYRHRNYSKVIEFVEFKERLQRSNQYLVARIELSILQLKQKADNVEEEEGVLESLDNGSLFVELSNKIGSKNLTFNEDFNARPWWTPVPGKNYLLGPFEGVSYCPKENMAKEREENVKKVIERKSLLPRLVYLSIQSASTISKEKVEMNGSSTVPKIPSELKFLLERYAKLLGSTLDDAIKVTMEVSSGVKSLEVFGSELVDWMNFAVFLNAWDLSSSEHLVLGDKHEGGVWPIIDALLEKSITVKTKFMEPRTYSPKVDLSSSVELVTGPLAWHILVLQSCVRSSLPSGKKKKKGGVTVQATARLSNGVRSSILSLYGVVEGITVRLKSYINVPEEENMDCILSSIKRDERVEGPGQAFQVLETSVSSADEAKLGSRIFDALKSWSPVDVAREIINGESACLSEFLRICETKLKSLRTLKQQTAQA